MNASLIALLKSKSPAPVVGDAVVGFGEKTILFHYGCPVAVFVPGRGVVSTKETISPTTSRRVNSWEHQVTHVKVPTSEFIEILEGEDG